MIVVDDLSATLDKQRTMRASIVTILGILAVAAHSVLADSLDEPMVAFLCNRPAMHATDRGWVKDDSTNCLKDPVDILNYCRKVYPRMDVWNVVESSETVTIGNWCNFGHSRCRHRFTVRPFRCLVGAFQSEALQVPEHCQFDHIHDSSECKSFAAWNITTTAECGSRHGSWLHGFSVLQPCGIDGFNGAEFVCCPSGVATTQVHTHPTTSTTTTTQEPTTEVVTSTVAMPTTTTLPVISLRDVEELSIPMKASSSSSSKMDSESQQHHASEHEHFLRAKASLEKRHHEKVAKMMKEWAAARHRVQEIKKIDMKGGEKFNREMTARFQKAYESLEHEAALERKQMLGEHQQRVQQELSKKKTQAMELYLAALAEPEPDATQILTALMQYVKAEQKDRVHTINHYEHVEESDPVEAEAQRATVAAHLRGIDERVTQAIEMLARLPKYEKKIRAQIERFLSSYQSLDESLAVIMAKINEKSNHALPLKPANNPSTSALLTTDNNENLTTHNEATSAVAVGSTAVVAVSAVASGTTEVETDDSHETTKRSAVTAQTVVASTGAVTRQQQQQQQEKVAERRFVEVKQVIEHVAHNENSGLVVLENYIKKLPVHIDGNGHLVAPLAIAVCGVAVFIIVVVGIVMVRRRSAGVLSEHSVTEIDRSATAQQQHGPVAKVTPPVNGYENPTYQYYAAAEVTKTTAGDA